MQAVPSDHPPGAIAMITGDITRYAVAMQSVMALKVPPGSVNAWNMGVLIGKMLNQAFQTMMDNKSLQWVWVMGDDHTFAPDVITRLLDRNVDVIAPLCLNRVPPMDPTIVDHEKVRMVYLEDLPLSGLYKLGPTETCGDAGLLIRRKVLEAIPAPWYDHRISGSMAAEDQAFVRRVKDAGFDVYIDLDTAIGHIGHTEFFPIKKNGHWEVRMTGSGMRHIADMRPAPRADDAFRMPFGEEKLDAAE